MTVFTEEDIRDILIRCQEEVLVSVGTYYFAFRNIEMYNGGDWIKRTTESFDMWISSNENNERPMVGRKYEGYDMRSVSFDSVESITPESLSAAIDMYFL